MHDRNGVEIQKGDYIKYHCLYDETKGDEIYLCKVLSVHDSYVPHYFVAEYNFNGTKKYADVMSFDRVEVISEEQALLMILEG